MIKSNKWYRSLDSREIWKHKSKKFGIDGIIMLIGIKYFWIDYTGPPYIRGDDDTLYKAKKSVMKILDNSDPMKEWNKFNSKMKS